MVAIISMERDGFSKLRVECGELRINNYQFTKKKLRKRKIFSASFHSVLHSMREDSVSTFLNARGIGFIALVCWSFSLDVVFEKGIHQSVLFLFFGMKKFYLLLIGCVFLMWCGSQEALPFQLKQLAVGSGEVIIKDLGERQWQYWDFEGAITLNPNSYQIYQVTIPKYHFSHTFSYPRPQDIEKYHFPPLEDWQWVQSGALVVPPPYTYWNTETYPHRQRPFPYGESPWDTMLWIYEIPDASQDSSLLQIGRTVVAILQNFFQTESLLTRSLEDSYASITTEELEWCALGSWDRMHCAAIASISREREFLLWNAELPHLGIQKDLRPFAGFWSDELYGYRFQKCLGLDVETCKKFIKPWFSLILWDKKHPQEIWHYSHGFTPSRASFLKLQ